MQQYLSRTKRFAVFAAVILAFSGAHLQGVAAQSRESAMERIEKAIASGDAKALAGTMSQRVAVAVFGSSREYSQSQAEHVVKKFFADYPPSGYAIMKVSDSEQGAFVAGRYRSVRLEGAADLYLRLRDRDGKWELREIIVQTAPR